LPAEQQGQGMIRPSASGVHSCPSNAYPISDAQPLQ
jgi:hypothetical protein